MEIKSTALGSNRLSKPTNKSNEDLSEENDQPSSYGISQKLIYGCLKCHPSEYLSRYKRQPIRASKRDFNWDLNETKAVQIKCESFPEIGPFDNMRTHNHLYEINVF